jgi:hypothetical protein
MGGQNRRTTLYPASRNASGTPPTATALLLLLLLVQFPPASSSRISAGAAEDPACIMHGIAGDAEDEDGGTGGADGLEQVVGQRKHRTATALMSPPAAPHTPTERERERGGSARE